jgi:predicted transcriptional regulator
MENTTFLARLALASKNLTALGAAWREVDPSKVNLLELLLIDKHGRGLHYGLKGRVTIEAFKSARLHPSIFGDKVSVALNEWAAAFSDKCNNAKVTPRTKTQVLASGLMAHPCATVHDLVVACNITQATARAWFRRLVRAELAVRKSIGNTDYYLIPSLIELVLLASGMDVLPENSLENQISQIIQREVRLSFPAHYARYELIKTGPRTSRFFAEK